ncbi:hypothetical protein DID75_04670, partial [Candidatus Marinamargulisbacteria bacterium SCGC AG-410-N11]
MSSSRRKPSISSNSIKSTIKSKNKPNVVQGNSKNISAKNGKALTKLSIGSSEGQNLKNSVASASSISSVSLDSLEHKDVFIEIKDGVHLEHNSKIEDLQKTSDYKTMNSFYDFLAEELELDPNIFTKHSPGLSGISKDRVLSNLNTVLEQAENKGESGTYKRLLKQFWSQIEMGGAASPVSTHIKNIVGEENSKDFTTKILGKEKWGSLKPEIEERIQNSERISPKEFLHILDIFGKNKIGSGMALRTNDLHFLDEICEHCINLTTEEVTEFCKSKKNLQLLKDVSKKVSQGRLGTRKSGDYKPPISYSVANSLMTLFKPILEKQDMSELETSIHDNVMTAVEKGRYDALFFDSYNFDENESELISQIDYETKHSDIKLEYNTYNQLYLQRKEGIRKEYENLEYVDCLESYELGKHSNLSLFKVNVMYTVLDDDFIPSPEFKAYLRQNMAYFAEEFPTQIADLLYTNRLHNVVYDYQGIGEENDSWRDALVQIGNNMSHFESNPESVQVLCQSICGRNRNVKQKSVYNAGEIQAMRSNPVRHRRRNQSRFPFGSLTRRESTPIEKKKTFDLICYSVLRDLKYHSEEFNVQSLELLSEWGGDLFNEKQKIANLQQRVFDSHPGLIRFSDDDEYPFINVDGQQAIGLIVTSKGVEIIWSGEGTERLSAIINDIDQETIETSNHSIRERLNYLEKRIVELQNEDFITDLDKDFEDISKSNQEDYSALLLKEFSCILEKRDGILRIKHTVRIQEEDNRQILRQELEEIQNGNIDPITLLHSTFKTLHLYEKRQCENDIIDLIERFNDNKFLMLIRDELKNTTDDSTAIEHKESVRKESVDNFLTKIKN